jgi:hypothetical protein
MGKEDVYRDLIPALPTATQPPGTRSSAPDRDQHVRVRGGDLPGDCLVSHEVVLTAQGP